MDNNINLVIIVGPTGVGKTTVSIELAKRLNGEIISADSRLFYKGMNIGTAKPTMDEIGRIKHHLIDVTDLNHIWSLSVFQNESNKLIKTITEHGKLPIMVGGTGQYIRAITENWQVPEQKPDESMRKAIEKWGNVIGAKGLHDRLRVIDKKAAEMIDFRNQRRTIRALEVALKTGFRFSHQRNKNKSPYNTIIIGIIRPRTELYDRIDKRIDLMFASGFVAEVDGLLQNGFEEQLRKVSAIGYMEVIQYLKGDMSLEETIKQIKRKTRIFVRRQANWFKPGDPKINWFSANNQLLENIQSFITKKIYS
ncbi:MAG: tRNA (adenosine(37)-N6)-dimethylallyltransferase MiaA [Anaerolineaceae bacterium]|nr:tRNA (adenosine(37)-N6)-dimethylallyltransferase MiaA [Anaerolineaceae bacterium]